MKISGQVGKLFGALVLVLIAVALIPELFTSLLQVNDSSAPGWLYISLVTVVGAGVLFLIWRAIM